MGLSQRQREFFEQLADMQEFAVQTCLAQYKRTDKKTE